MSTKLPGSNPTAYLGIKETNPPQLYFFNRAPLATDARPYDAGDIWIDRSVDEAYILTAKIGAVATWVPCAGTGAAETLTGDIGGAVGPDAAENINILGGTDVTVTGTPGTNTLTIDSDSPAIDQQQIIYVGKHGNDANDGLTLDKAKLTFAAGITAALAIAPASVVCFDNGTYAEALTMQINVNINAENASLTGSIVAVDNSTVKFKVLNVATGATGIDKTAGTGIFICEIDEIICVGTGSASASTSGSINLKSRIVTIENGSVSSNATTNKIHLEIEDIFITGTGFAIGTAAAGIIDAEIQHISNQGAGAGTGIATLAGNLDVYINQMDVTTAINNVGGGAATINYVGNSINAVTAYNINAASTLNLTVNTITGAETIAGGGTVNIYQNDSGIRSNQTYTFDNPELAATQFQMLPNGTRTLPLQPFFYATMSADIDNVTGNTTTYTLILNTEVADIGNNYNPATGIFTAPVDGIYIFNSTIGSHDYAVGNTNYVHKIEVPGASDNLDAIYAVNPGPIFRAAATEEMITTLTHIFNLNASDQVRCSLRVDGAAQIIDINSSVTSFSGYLLG